jgi:hypothetical protein
VPSDEVEYTAATVASAGTLALAGIASVPDAPPGSDGSGTGTVVAPGAGVGIATAFEAVKAGGPDWGAEVGPLGGSAPFGLLVPEPPPPPPQAASAATPRTAPPRSAEIRFMP